MPGRTRMAAEVCLVALGLLVNILFAPLGSDFFVVVPVAGSLLAAGYAAWCLVRQKDVCSRWGIAPGILAMDPRDDDFRQGCLVLAAFYLIALIPMAIARTFLLQLPFGVPNVALYLCWCAVQDFIFFGVTQRHLEDLTNPLLAVLLTAVLFGLSHYPFTDFVLLTTLAGLFWGYAFLRLRALWFVVLAHWAMGVVILG